MTAAGELTVLDAEAFVPLVDQAVEVYLAAMHRDPALRAARLGAAEAHVATRGFRAACALRREGEGADRLVGYAYGYPGAPGQWWREAVTPALGPAAAEWLAHDFDVAEVHVLPSEQGRGLGRRLVSLLLADRPERTVLLTAVDEETPARGLYRSMGLRDLATGFRFAAGGETYAVMGAPLPLPGRVA